ncbi:HlyD family type I secretion periplasmic adaptor subunit [Rhodovibrionaceae bacterium A322]
MPDSRALVPVSQKQQAVAPYRGRARTRYSDFLPDAQAVVEREHSPVARWLLFILVALVGAFVTYISLVSVDQVATAVGVVRPAGQVKLINHPNGGRVAALLVQEGQKVSKDQPLVVLDPDVSEEEVGKLQAELFGLNARQQRLEAEAMGVVPDFGPTLSEAHPTLVTAQLNLYKARRDAFVSRRDAAAEVVEQREKALIGLEARVAQMKESLRIIEEQEASISELVGKGYFPKLRYLSVQRQLSDAIADLTEVEASLAAAGSALSEAVNNLDSLEREWEAGVLDELTQVMSESERISRTLEQQRSNLRNLTLRSPTEGIVQDLVVAAAGQAIAANEPMMKIVPVGDSLIVEALVANDDIGFISDGQEAQVKVTTYDFIKFGALEGTVERIAPDATRDEKGQLQFEVLVRTDKTYLGDVPGRLPVVPGMTTQVDFKTGRRTILSFLTDRLRTTAAEAFRAK